MIMSKHIRVKLTCEIEFNLEDLNYVSAEDVADAIREAEGLDPFDAIEESHIIAYVEAQDVYEMNDQFGIVDADIQEVIVE
jgi:hypothetical protein